MNEETSLLGLATIRKNRGITLQQIAASTKIGVRSLEAIERGDFGKLPGGIYTTSYIRQYARAIDYDESAILAVYNRTMAGSDANATDTGGDGKGKYSGLPAAPDTVES
jgi:cytoskeleton protein RodZ